MNWLKAVLSNTTGQPVTTLAGLMPMGVGVWLVYQGVTTNNHTLLTLGLGFLGGGVGLTQAKDGNK